MNFQMFKLVLEKAEEPEIKLPTSTGSSKKRVPEKTSIFAFYWLCQRLRLCGSQYTVENSYRNGNTRLPDLPLEKSVCRSGSNSRTGHGTTDCFQIGKVVCQGCILSPCLFNLCRVHHEKCWAGRSTSWNQDFPEKHKYPDMQMTPPLWQKVKRRKWKAFWWKWKRRVKKLS